MKDFSWPIGSYNVNEYISFEKQLATYRNQMIGRNIYIYGAGIRGCMFVEFCKRLDIIVSGFFDGDENKWGGIINDSYVISCLSEYDAKKYIIISTEMYNPIVEKLKEYGLKEGKDFFYVESVVYDVFIEKFFKKIDVSYTFMGDCIFSTVGLNDSCKDSLEDILRQKLNDRAEFLTVHGMPLRTFYHLLRLRIILEMAPKYLVVVVNTVMFSGKKSILPRAQHTPLLEKINCMLPYDDVIFKEYIDVTKQRSNRYNTDSFVTNSSNSKSRSSDAVLKLRMKQNYMYQIKTDNEGIVYLKKICELCKAQGIEFVGFLPPINYEFGIKLFGDSFKKASDLNISVVKNIISQYGFNCCDISYMLKSSEFASYETINEITNYEGRKKEAEFLLKWLISQRK